MPKLKTMRKYMLLWVVLFFQVLAFSCSKDDKIHVLSYNYEKFASNLNESVSCIQFVDNNNGYAANYLGKVFKTIDNGINWQSNSLTDLPLRSIYFIDKNVGYIVGGQSSCGGTGCIVPGSIVFKTINGGASWNKQTVPYEWSELNSVFFINENVGFAIGLGLQLKTTNGGITWNNFEFDVNCLMTKVLFINSRTGFAAGLSGNIFRTTDQGKTWSKANNNSDGHIYDFCFPNGAVGYAAGQKEIVKTVDGGNTWNVLINSPTEIYFIHFADILNGIAIGKGHYTGGDFGFWTSAIFSTSDGGTTWKMEDNINFSSLASFPSNNSGYSLGMNSIFKITLQ
jgi:photosystem II stability/assembly factor-like uncharacterized protein